MRGALAAGVLVVGASLVASAEPEDACGRAAFDELVKTRERLRALEGSGVPSAAAVIDVAWGLPIGFVEERAAHRDLRELLAAKDAQGAHAALERLDRDVEELLADAPWRLRCEAHPQWYVALPPLTRAELVPRREIGQRTATAQARARACMKLTSTVLAQPESKRSGFGAALDQCYRDLEANRAQCQRDLDGLVRVEGDAPMQAAEALATLLKIRHGEVTADDLAVARKRIGAMLDGLRPPLAELAGPTRAALSREKPQEALYELEGTLKDLYSPCEQMWPSEPSCVIRPEMCEPKPNSR